MPHNHQELSARVKAFAVAKGADLVGIALPETYTDYCTQVQQRIEETGATLRDFMIADDDVSFFDRLCSATNTLPSARAILIIGAYAYDEMAYYCKTRKELRGRIARTYSYYPVVRQVAESVTAYLRELGYKATHGQDVPLKHVAHRIGLGCYGKNGLLLTEKHGSYVALRDVITDAPLEPDLFERVSFCRDCDRCLKACPTGALYAPYKVDPRRCFNPITRRKDRIAPALRRKMQNWIHGCDICQEVCPANQGLIPRKADPRSGFDPGHHASHRDLGGLERTPRLLDLLGSDRPEIIRRNAAIALANVGRGHADILAALSAKVAEAGDELRHYLRWAMERLAEDHGCGRDP
jgi:epoxyqueuosine reductase